MAACYIYGASWLCFGCFFGLWRPWSSLCGGHETLHVFRARWCALWKMFVQNGMWTSNMLMQEKLVGCGGSLYTFLFDILDIMCFIYMMVIWHGHGFLVIVRLDYVMGGLLCSISWWSCNMDMDFWWLYDLIMWWELFYM